MKQQIQYRGSRLLAGAVLAAGLAAAVGAWAQAIQTRMRNAGSAEERA